MQQSCKLKGEGYATVVTIDGPTASGKGTVGKLLADKLGWNFLDSGALYRVLALAAMQNNLYPNDHEAIIDLAQNLQVEFINTPAGKQQVMYQGYDVSGAIRQEGCGVFASQVAVLPNVRSALLRCQRSLRKPPGLVANGRDMGTIVFPDAILKVFLTAAVEIRAERRFQQLQDKGISANLPEVQLDLVERDKRDEKRIYSPLKPATDAFIVETSSFSIPEVVQLLLDKVRLVL